MNSELNIPWLFERFTGMQVLVIGDVMLDSYLFGSVDRISPEAPVPIVSVNRKEDRLGGAANVAINIQSLGARPFLCSVTGEDAAADLFEKLMQDQDLSRKGIIRCRERVTTIKTRIIGNNHQLLRVDEEQTMTISDEESARLLSVIKQILDSEKTDVILMEDYDKGVLHPELIRNILELARSRQIPVTVDPKKRNFLSYDRVSLFKPNLHELKTGLKTDIDRLSLESLNKTAGKFRTDHAIDRIMVTLSEAGVYVADDTGSTIIPAHIRNISDVSGAGDTVISVASLCLAAGLSLADMAALSNLAGGLVCEKVGVVPIDKDQFMEEALLLSAD